MKINLRTSLAGLIAATVALAVVNTSQAINVYTTADSGPGSLRQAINDSNAGAGNTIFFSNVVTGTITLTTGELLIATNVTIIGPGANVLAVSGNAASRVFHITNAVTVSISGLTITNGHATVSPFPANSGGAILNGHSTLTVSHCTVSGNSAGDGGGIYNDGDHSSATLTLIASTLSGNSASTHGGGVFNDGFSGSAMLTVMASTFSGNSAANAGGGIYNSGYSGGAALTVIASTFSGNSAANAGGGIWNEATGGSATLEIGNTILNAGVSGANIANGLGTVTSRGYNLSSDDGGGFLMGVGDQINTDPKLGRLQDNGGPTPTMMPATNSAAIDQGKSGGLTTDQRGRARPFDNPAIPNATLGDGCDIGAVEVYPSVTLVVSNTNDSGVNSLRQAIVDAAPIDTITFASGVSGTITLTSGELLIDKNAAILGPTALGVTVSGNNASRVFHITAGTVSISRLTIASGSTSGAGAGVFNETGCTLSLTNCTLNANTSSGGGGAVANNGAVTAVNCTFYGNQSNGGGGLYNYAGTLNIFNSTVASNSASGTGGGVYAYSVAGTVTTFRNSVVASNSAPTGPDVAGVSNGSFTSQGYNLIGNTSGSAGFGATGDQLNVDPLLGPLADNGGPTLTMALRVGSPAIDQGKGFGLTTDQRGEPRPFDNPSIGNATGGDGSDIGAFERGGGLWSGATDLGNGWKWFGWLGFFNTAYDPWVYHLQHGFLYPVGTDTSSVFFWDNGKQAWWWTSATVYPYLYRFSDSSWLWYQEDSAGPRWFYNLTAGKWESW